MIKQVLLGVLVCLPLWAAGEGALRDPTLPPDAKAENTEDGAFRLEAVIRPRGDRPSAVINGRTVKLGEEIQGMKLIAVREASVLLRGAQGSESVLLAPGVEKTVKSPQPERPAAKKNRGGGA